MGCEVRSKGQWMGTKCRSMPSESMSRAITGHEIDKLEQHAVRMSQINQAVSFNSHTNEVEQAGDASVLLISIVRSYRAGPSSVRYRVRYVFAGMLTVSFSQ